MSVSLTLAWRYLWGRRLRTALTTLAVVFGVAIIFGLNGMLPGMIDAFNRVLLSAAGQVDLSVTSASGGVFDPAVARDVSRVRGVAAATPSLRRNVGLPRGADVSAITLVGIEPRTAMRVREFAVTSGRMVAGSDRAVAVIGADTAEKLGVGLGGTIAVPTVAGIERLRVVGLLAGGSSPGSPEVYVSLSEAGRMLGLPGKASTVEGRLEPGAERATVESAVRRAVGDEYTVGGLSTENQLLASLKISQFAFTMFGTFALIMGGFIILNTFRTLVSERRRDIGMMRAIGASRSTVMNVFLYQSLIQGVLGTALGLLAGYGLASAGINAIAPIWRDTLNMDLGVIQPQFTLQTWVAAIVLGIGVTVLGAIIPARQAASITPLEALRPQIAEVAERGHRRGVLVGAGMLAVSVPMLATRQSGAVGLGAVFFLVGLILVAPALIEPLSRVLSRIITPLSPATADLANSNLTRQPGRAAATASAILVSLAVVVSMLGIITSIYAGFFSYIDTSLGSDFVTIPQGLLMGGGHVGADERLVERIASTPGISDVATMRLAMARIAGGSVQFVGIDPETYPRVSSFTFSEGTGASDIADLGSGRTVLVNGIYAAQNGVRSGQVLKVETPNGVKDYTVVGIATDYLNAKLATVYISQENLAEDFGVTSNVMVLANAEPGASIPQVKVRLDHLLADYPQFILYDSQGFKDTQAALFAQTLGMFYVFIGMLALPTLLALLNTLAISVLSRTREIGMLRAVGATRAQIRGMVVAESMLLAAVGVIFGVIGGVALGYALVFAMNATGFVMPYFFPWAGVWTAVIAGFTFALLAALLPSRQAAHLDIVAALHYE